MARWFLRKATIAACPLPRAMSSAVLLSQLSKIFIGTLFQQSLEDFEFSFLCCHHQSGEAIFCSVDVHVVTGSEMSV